MAHTTIDLTLEVEVVNANLEPLESDSPEWEEAQNVCIEAAQEHNDMIKTEEDEDAAVGNLPKTPDDSSTSPSPTTLDTDTPT